MEKQGGRVLQVSVSKSPVYSVIFDEHEVGKTLREIYDCYSGLSEEHTKIFINGEEELNWEYKPKPAEMVSVCQIPQYEAVIAYVVPALIALVVGAIVGYILYKSIDQPNTDQGSKINRITGARNEAKPYEVVPVVIGNRRVVPPYAAQPYTYWSGNNQWLKMLFCVGYGPLSISNIKIGDADISNFRDINYEVLDWYNNKDIDTIKNIWGSDVQQETVNQNIPDNSYITRAAPADTNKLRLDYVFPGGLWVGGELDALTNGVMFRFYYNGDRYTVARVRNTIDGYSVRESGGRYYVGMSNDVTSYFVNEIDGYVYLKNYNGFLYTNVYRTATRNQFTKSFTWKPIDPVTQQPITGPVSYELRRKPIGGRSDGQIGEDIQFSTATYELNPDVGEGYFGVNKTQGLYPVIIAVDIRATDQLNGIIENLSCQAESVVPDIGVTQDWKNYSIDGSYVKSNNPADLYKWVLQGPFNAGAVDNDKIDNLILSEWRQTCVDRGWETNEVVDYEVTLKDLLNNIAFTGRAFFSMREGVFSVIENKQKDNPVQIFTIKNSSGMKSRREFDISKDGIRYTFANADYAEQEDEGYYADPDRFYNSNIERPKEGTTVTGRYDDFEVWGTTDPEIARTHARFAYFENKLRREIYQLDTDIESLVARRGDKVLVASDIIDVGLGQGFIKEIDGTSFRVDETINLVSGTDYAITIRSIENGVNINTITASYISDGWWEGSLPSGSSVGDLVAYGEAGTETLECLVTEVTYNDDYTATLTLVNYAEDLYSVDYGYLPEYQSGLNPERPSDVTPLAPVVTVDLSGYKYEVGSVSVIVSKQEGDLSDVKFFSLQYRYEKTGDSEYEEDEKVWEDAGVVSASNGLFNIPVPLNNGNSLVVRAQAINGRGVYSAFSAEKDVVISDNPAQDIKSLTLDETVNEPKTPDARWSTIDISIEPPDDQSEYLYAIAEYKQPGQSQYKQISTLGWNKPNSTSLQVYADGRQYEIRIRSVSIYGIENKYGVSKLITTTNTEDPEYTEDNPFRSLPAPNVTGLELFGQGNDNEFIGRDAKFTWRKNTLVDWVNLGYEGLKGASSSELDQYFRDYQIEVFANDELVRTETVVDNFYTYTYEKNAEDYEARYGVVGAYRNFRLSVIMRTRQNQESPRAAVLDVVNTAPKPLQGLVINPGFNSIEINYKQPTDLDFSGVDIWVETTQGFDPDVTTPFATVSDNSFIATGLQQGTTYYVRLRPFDEFGKTDTNTTSEISILTKTGLDLTGLSGWAYQIDPADRTFIENNLADSAVPSQKIVNLTAAKITTGTLNATESITAEGIIRAVDDASNPQYQVGVGPNEIDGVSYIMWGYDSQAAVGNKLKFGIDENGNAYFKGDLEASTFTNNNLTIDEQGNLDSTGNFRFGGTTSDYIEFDGTNLVVNSDNFSINPSGDAVFSGQLQAASGTFTGQLQAATGSFTGDVTLTGDNLWANTRVQVGGEQTDSDYVVIDVDESGNGLVETYKKFGGEYRRFKSLTRTESGVANSGTLVQIPGYWTEQPKVQVSPNTVPTYDPAYSDQSQTWSCQAQNLTETSAGKWEFTAVSNLQLGAASGSKAVNDEYEGSNDYTTPAIITEPNTTDITAYVGLKSIRGTGQAPDYYYREVLWRIGYSSTETGTYTWSTYQTKQIGQSFDYVSDNRTISLPSSGTWYIKIDYIARDAGGTFSIGGASYEYDTVTVSNTNTVQDELYTSNDGVYQNTILPYTLPSYSPSGDWEIYKVDYSVEYAYYIAATDEQATTATFAEVSSNIGFQHRINADGIGTNDEGDINLTNWTADALTVSTSSYDENFLDGDLTIQTRNTFDNVAARSKLALRNGEAVIYIRKPITNSTTPQNGFRFNYFDYDLSSAQIITPGVLNWLAVGD